MEALRHAVLGLLALVLLANSALLARADTPPPGAVLAEVGRTHVTVDAFQKRYKDYLVRTGQQDDLRLRRRVLRDMIDVRLMAQAMMQAGLTDDKAYREEVEHRRHKLLVDLYVQRTLFDTLQVRESDLRMLFVRANTELNARHLYARTLPEARQLRERLREGASFEQLARESFADTTLARNGGSLGWFSFDEMDQAFETAAYALEVGEISAPVRTAQGYSIIEVTGRRTKPVLTETEFAKKKDELRLFALRRQRTNARARHLRSVMRALELSFEAEAIERLHDDLTGRRLAPSGETAGEDTPVVTFAANGRRQTWTVRDVEQRMRRATDEQRARARHSRRHLHRLIAGLMAREEMLRRARSEDLHRSRAFREALAQSMQQWLYRKGKKRIRREVNVPTDSLRAHFEAHRSRYKVPEKVRVREILVEEKAQADRLRARLESGASFEQLARQHSVRPGAASIGGDLGLVSRAQVGRFADRVFSAEAGDLLGPVSIKGRYALLKVGRRAARRPARFDEVRSKVKNTLSERMTKERLHDYLRRLRDRYTVSIDEKRLAALRLLAET